jgi:hypothetical protein
MAVYFAKQAAGAGTRNCQRPSLARRGAFGGEGLSAKLTGGTAGKPDGPAASKPSWPTFSPSPGKTWTRSGRGCGSPSPAARRSFRVREPNNRRAT